MRITVPWLSLAFTLIFREKCYMFPATLPYFIPPALAPTGNAHFGLHPVHHHLHFLCPTTAAARDSAADSTRDLPRRRILRGTFSHPSAVAALRPADARGSAPAPGSYRRNAWKYTDQEPRGPIMESGFTHRPSGALH